jgi:hypothetical protein
VAAYYTSLGQCKDECKDECMDKLPRSYLIEVLYSQARVKHEIIEPLSIDKQPGE